MKIRMSLAAMAGLAVTGAAMAQGVPGGGDFTKEYFQLYDPPRPLADSVSGVPGVTSSTIFVQDSGIIESFKAVFIDIQHTWVGDLVIELIHNDNVVRLINRPGFTGTGFGSSADLNGLYFFADGLGPFQTTSSPSPVPPGGYGPVDPLDVMAGKDKFGEWTLRITDNAGGDTGVLRSWGFVVNNVPTPGALALLGLGGLVASRRRRA